MGGYSREGIKLDENASLRDVELVEREREKKERKGKQKGRKEVDEIEKCYLVKVASAHV